jgi:hypothetical protein
VRSAGSGAPIITLLNWFRRDPERDKRRRLEFEFMIRNVLARAKTEGLRDIEIHLAIGEACTAVDRYEKEMWLSECRRQGL